MTYYLFMANKSSRYEVLPDEDLQPQHPVPGVPLERQAEAMRELRAMHNEILADSSGATARCKRGH